VDFRSWNMHEDKTADQEEIPEVDRSTEKEQWGLDIGSFQERKEKLNRCLLKCAWVETRIRAK
jgi:hypothetical protein